MILLIICLGLIILYALTVVYMVYFGANYVQTPPAVIAQIAAMVKPVQTIVDLGCGNGEILEAALQHGARMAIGYELDGYRFIKTMLRLKPRYAGKIRFHWADVRQARLENADIVFTFFSPRHIKALYDKASRQMQPKTLFVSYMHPVPGVRADSKKNHVFIYQMKG